MFDVTGLSFGAVCEEMEHEALMCELFSRHGNIRSLLETFFKFLALRTDFFHVMDQTEARRGEKGFWPGEAECFIADTFASAQVLYCWLNQIERLPKDLAGCGSVEEVLEKTKLWRGQHMSSTVIPGSPISQLVVLPGLGDDVSSLLLRSDYQLRGAAARAALKERKASAVKVETPVPPPSASNPTRDSRPPKEAKSALISSWNGADLEWYVWSQTIADVTCQIRLRKLLQDLGEEVKAVNVKDLKVLIQPTEIKVSFRGEQRRLGEAARRKAL